MTLASWYIYLLCHGSKLGFDGLHMTTRYYDLNKVFDSNCGKKKKNLSNCVNERGECTI